MSECLTPTNCEANCKAKSLVAKCGSVSEKFAYLMQTKDLMRKMLISKDQDVPADLPFRDYIEKIAALVPTTDVVNSIIDYKGDTHKGDVTVDKNFIDLSNVDNTADIDKPISTATQEALDLKQNITDDSLETEAKTIVGAINELDGEVATNTANIGTLQTTVGNAESGLVKDVADNTAAIGTLQTTVGNAESGLVKDVADNTAAIGTLQTSLAGKQDATISVNIQGEAKTTIPDALTSLDTALTAVKTTADGAAKVDASNIVPATWKGVLGYQSASDVSAAVIAGVTTNTYDDNLDTTSKTIVGAINELDGEVATNTANIGTLQTSLAGKQDATISVNIQGEAKTTIPDALTSLDTALTAVKTTADGAAKVDASNIVPATWKGVLGYQSASDVSAAVIAGVTTNTYDDNLDTTSKTIVGAINEVNTTLSNKQDKLKLYSETIDPASSNSATISATNIKLEGSVAEGTGTTASGVYSHAEGSGTTASGSNSHAEGSGTTASGVYSHAEGRNTTASGSNSHAEGYYTTASSDYQHVQGYYNIADADDKYADIIGNGSSNTARSNAATVSWEGISWSKTDVRSGGTDQDSAAHSLAAKQNATDNSLTTTAKTVVGAINEINTSNSGKQDSSISIDGITADTVEGALAELDTAISALQNKTQDMENRGGETNFQGLVTTGSLIASTLTAATQLTVNGSVTGSAIQKTLSASSTDEQLPSAKAVYDGLAAKQDALTYYEESTDSGGSVIVGATTQAETPPSAVTVANGNISVQLTTSTLNTSNTNGGILNRETAFNSTSKTGSITIPSNVSSLAGYKVVFDTIASEGGAKSRTIFEYDATNNVWYREVIFGTGASITSMSGSTVNYDLGVAVSSANIVVSML